MDDLEKLEEELFKNPNFKREYDALETEYELKRKLIEAMQVG